MDAFRCPVKTGALASARLATISAALSSIASSAAATRGISARSAAWTWTKLPSTSANGYPPKPRQPRSLLLVEKQASSPADRLLGWLERKRCLGTSQSTIHHLHADRPDLPETLGRLGIAVVIDDRCIVVPDLPVDSGDLADVGEHVLRGGQ